MQRGQPKAIMAEASSRAGLIFFAQRLAELTNYYSLDSFKAPSANVPVLVDEAIRQIELIMDGAQGVSEGSIEPILSEIQTRLAKNIVIKSMMPTQRIDAFRSSLNDYRQCLKKLRVISQDISQRSYTTKCMDLLISYTEKESKSDIDYLLRELVTGLENMGMSKHHIYQSTIQYFFLNKPCISNPKDIRKFFEKIFPHHHLFDVCFKTSALVDHIESDHFKAFSMKVLDTIPVDFAVASIGTPFENAQETEKFIVVSNIRAFDRTSAIRKSLKKVALIQNLFRMYHHKQTFNIGESVLVKQCCIEGIVHEKYNISAIQAVHDDRPRKAAKKLDTLLKETNFNKGGDFHKFLSVVEFHGMSLDSNSLENQLLNLWISLETISPSQRGMSKIDSVISAALPIIGLTYLSRLADRIAYDLLVWNRKIASETLRLVEPEGTDDWTDRLLAICGLPDHEKNLAGLFSKMGENELLRHRIYSFHRLIKDPLKALQSIDAHNQRVSWQIRRIYRARNAIVHNGESPTYMESIVQNAHDYFDQVMHATVDASCGSSGFSTYENCFNYFAWEFEAYVEKLKGHTEVSRQTLEAYRWRRVSTISREDVLQRRVRRKALADPKNA